MFRRLRTILVGLDGSEYCQVATELGIRWVKQSEGMLVGMGVIDEPAISSPTAAPLGGFHFAEQAQEARLNQERGRVEQILSQFSLRCAEAGVACKLLEAEGHPHERLLFEAQRYDLVMLGRQTYFRYETEQPDETLTEVIKNSPRPVVTVPSSLPSGDSVVIAYDGSLQAARALYTFWSSGVGGERKLHVVSVASERAEAAKVAQVASQFLHSHKLEATNHPIVSRESVGDIILEKLTELKAEMLVMGAYGQPRLREFFLGSVTRHVMMNSPVPMFLSH